MGSNTADAVLQFINKNYITLQVDDKKYNNEHYLKVLEEFINQMKFNDDLFNNLYEKLVFAGSYYDGLKISKPEEYDVDVVMRLPVNYDTIELKCKKVSAGFVKVRATEIEDAISDNKNNNVYQHMDSWTDHNGFLLQDEFRSWMFSVVDKTMTSLTKLNSTTAELAIDGETYQILRRSNGPASTLNITIPSGAKIDVDLVPVIEFKYPLHWPTQVRRNPFPDKESWFIVPKDNSKDKREFQNTYWRLAFHQQEKELLKDKVLLKPVCRLLKKLRDKSGLRKVVSYFIKTIFLSAVDEEDATYWNTSLSGIFMAMLVKLSKCFSDRKIEYFWDKRNNLLTGSGITVAEMSDIHKHLQDIITDITKKMSKDPTVFAKHLLTETELRKFNREYLKKEDPTIVTDVCIYEYRKAAQLAIENRALKNQLTQTKNEHKQFAEQMENMLERMNLLVISVQNIHNKQERTQNGVGHLFSIVKRNPYF